MNKRFVIQATSVFVTMKSPIQGDLPLCELITTALCNDGTIWIRGSLKPDKWLSVEDIPQPEEPRGTVSTWTDEVIEKQVPPDPCIHCGSTLPGTHFGYCAVGGVRE